MFNSTIFTDDNTDTFPLSYEDDHFDSLSNRINRSFYDDFLSHPLNKTSTSSTSFSFSSPFTYIILIVSCYFILTIVLLTFSLYRQRQNEMENFYFGDTEEDIERGKRSLAWKQLLIRKLKKGDMEPLLTDRETHLGTFPLDTVNGCINVIRMGVDLARGILVDDNVGQEKETSIVDSRELMSAVN